MATFVSIIKRTYYLRGDSDYTTATTDLTIIKDHINAAIQDIANAFPFSWNIATTTLTLAAGVADLPTNFNPKWQIEDARIENTSYSDDNVFTQVGIDSRDQSTDDYVYWITYDTTTSRYIFNTPTQTGSVVVKYHFFPTDLSGDSDVCVVPDGEAVAYLAAAKMWIGDERNQALKTDYEQEAGTRVKELYRADMTFGPIYSVPSIASINTLGE